MSATPPETVDPVEAFLQKEREMFKRLEEEEEEEEEDENNDGDDDDDDDKEPLTATISPITTANMEGVDLQETHSEPPIEAPSIVSTQTDGCSRNELSSGTAPAREVVGENAVTADCDESLVGDVQQAAAAQAAAESTGSRASISLQRVASVEEISRAMARAEQGRPRSRRRRQESETMQQWRRDFEERLKVKDELEAAAVDELRKQAEKEKEEWYAQWRADLEERRDQRRIDEQEAADAMDKKNSSCWQRMSLIAKSLSVRRESKDMHRMRALLIALEKPPKRNAIIA